MLDTYGEFDKIIEVFNRAGVSDKLLVCGSCATHVYQHVYEEYKELIFATTDIDFSIKNREEVSNPVNVAKLLEDLGYEHVIEDRTELGKFVNPVSELVVEFLTDKNRRVSASSNYKMSLHDSGTDTVFKIKPYAVSAQGLSYQDMLHEGSEIVNYKGCLVKVPKPEVLAVQKLIISELRTAPEKADKDRATAYGIIRIMEKAGNQAVFENYLNSLPPKTRNRCRVIFEKNREEYAPSKGFSAPTPANTQTTWIPAAQKGSPDI